MASKCNGDSSQMIPANYYKSCGNVLYNIWKDKMKIAKRACDLKKKIFRRMFCDGNVFVLFNNWQNMISLLVCATMHSSQLSDKGKWDYIHIYM